MTLSVQLGTLLQILFNSPNEESSGNIVSEFDKAQDDLFYVDNLRESRVMSRESEVNTLSKHVTAKQMDKKVYKTKTL